MNAKQKISNPKSHFTILPNLYDDADLNVHEFRLLAHYRRVGSCWESVRTTSEKCRMSVGSVVKFRDSLAAQGWIRINKNGEKAGTVEIEVVDRWSNSECSPDEQGESERSPGEPERSPDERPRSPDETKKYLSLRSTSEEEDSLSELEILWVQVLGALRMTHYPGAGIDLQRFDEFWGSTKLLEFSDVDGAVVECSDAELFDARFIGILRSAFISAGVGSVSGIHFVAP